MLADRIFGAPGRRDPPRRKRQPARSPRRRGGARARVRGRSRGGSSPEVLQRRLDLAGLGCIALAVYLGYVLYLDWNGGTVGEGSETALSYAVGAGTIVVPVVLGLAGLGLILRPFLPSPRSVAVGVVAIACGLLLVLAAQTAGLGPDGARTGLFDPTFFPDHGGGLGEVLYWATTTLFQRIGAHIIAVLLLVCGLLLITGRSVSDMVRAARRGFDRAKRGTIGFATAVKETRLRTDPDLIDTSPASTEPIFGPPEPVEGGADFQVIPQGGSGDARARDSATRDLQEEPPPDVNFDEAVRVADESHTNEIAGPGGKAEAIRVAKAGKPNTPGDAAEDVGDYGEAVEPEPLTPMGKRRGGVTESEELDFELPVAERVLERGAPEKGPDKRDHEEIARTLLETFGHFGVEARIVGTVTGPHVSRYELKLAPGTKVSKITQLKDDLAYALASTDIRILAPIPGKQAVGVEVPNQRRRLVRLGDIYGGRPEGASPLVAWLGKDISGSAVWTDLQKMPHALVAGTTGSGKSGSINAILSSVLLHASPNEVRMVLVDPKRVELNHYEKIPHLLTPVVTSPRLAANVLNNLIAEMESRYRVMEEARARNLAELNRVRERERDAPLPHILCVIDELADLMMVAPAEVEDAIIRLAQKSRAVGIHLLLATQRPSTDIITGTIKVNIPARIAFAVSSQVDSRVILDQGGAETLLGQGDMLFRPAGTSKMQRIQGAFITEAEIARITEHWSEQGEPDFADELLEAAQPPSEEAGDDDFDPDSDDLLQQAAQLVVESGTASVSMIQRRLRVGYTRAGRLIDMLERRGIISGYEGSKPRQVLVSLADLPRVVGGGEPQDARAAGEEVPEPVAAPQDE
jgi:S-DNA-T family DNA segregation ATPase FtsK/SpoIIIE